MPNDDSHDGSAIARSEFDGDTLNQDRRKLLGLAGAATALAISRYASPDAFAQDARTEPSQVTTPDEAFRERAYAVRVATARSNRDATILPHPTNGDEARHANLIGSDTRRLPHDQRGEVDQAAFKATLKAYGSGDPADFEVISARRNA